MVDDPRTYGQVAAANALSDIYAMGAVPFAALNIGCFPSCLAPSVIEDILRGGLDKLTEAGALLVGGHSVIDEEVKYGMSVSGWVHPRDLTPNSRAQPQDVLVLTKPIGTGLLINALKGELLSEEDYSTLTYWLTRLNRLEAEVMIEIGVNACTDITGFGLLGHAWEMASGSGVQISLNFSRVPKLPNVLDWASMGLVPKGSYANHRHLRPHLDLSNVSEAELDLLLDPQTSGGLLISVAPNKVDQLRNTITQRGGYSWIIGEISTGDPKIVVGR